MRNDSFQLDDEMGGGPDAEQQARRACTFLAAYSQKE